MTNHPVDRRTFLAAAAATAASATGFAAARAPVPASLDTGFSLGVQYLGADPTPDALERLDKLCEEYKIAIAIHPHGPSGKGERHRWWSAEVIMKAVKDHYRLIGACLDTGHLIRMAQLGEKLDP